MVIYEFQIFNLICCNQSSYLVYIITESDFFIIVTIITITKEMQIRYCVKIITVDQCVSLRLIKSYRQSAVYPENKNINFYLLLN